MRIVVNHLTRMTKGYVCVAGLDDGEHIRPVSGRLERRLISVEGGVFDIGSNVDLGPVVPQPSPPETEDREFQRPNLKVVGVMKPGDYWRMLDGVSRARLSDVFGSDLVQRKSGATVDPGQGNASLGVIKPSGKPRLYTNSFGSLRITIRDPLGNLDLSVTDLRLVEQDHKTVRESVVDDLDARIKKGIPLLLSVGLARQFRATGDTQERHWLQVNNLHLKDNPIWRIDD